VCITREGANGTPKTSQMERQKRRKWNVKNVTNGMSKTSQMETAQMERQKNKRIRTVSETQN
jgi:hypothetical protein